MSSCHFLFYLMPVTAVNPIKDPLLWNLPQQQSNTKEYPLSLFSPILSFNFQR